MFRNKSLILSLSFFLFVEISNAQTVSTSGWFLSLNTYKINNSWTGYIDVQVRSSDQVKNLQTLILRPGIQYNFNKTLNATLGYALVENRRTIGGINGYVHEQRIWEQLQVMHRLAFTMVNHRFRLEQRFISKPVIEDNMIVHDGYNLAHRFRYFFRDIIPLNGKQPFTKGGFASLQNEVFINIGDKSTVNGKYFDQNRAYGSFGYRFSPKFDLEAGYLNQYVSGQNKSTTNNHIIQVASYIRL